MLSDYQKGASCLILGAFLSLFPLNVMAQPSTGLQQATLACQIESSIGKNKIRLFSDFEKNDLFYYIPTKMNLLTEKSSDGKLLPAINLTLTQRKDPKTNELEEFSDLECKFELDLSAEILEKVEKELKKKITDLKKVTFQALPIISSTALFYNKNGEMLVNAPAILIKTETGTCLKINARLNRNQTDQFLKSPATVVFYMQYNGKVKAAPYEINYDEEKISSSMKQKSQRQAFMQALLSADNDSLANFKKIFEDSKIVEWHKIENEDKFSGKKALQLFMKNKHQLDSKEVTRLITQLLFSQLNRLFSVEFPKSLPSGNIDNQFEKFIDNIELSSVSTNEKPEKQVLNVAVETNYLGIAAAVGMIDLSSLSQEIRDKVVSIAKPELYALSNFYLPSLGYDPSINFTNISIEILPLDNRKQKLADPLKASYDFKSEQWKDQKEDSSEALKFDFNSVYKKIENQLKECSFQITYRVSQKVFNKDRSIEIVKFQPFIFGDVPVNSVWSDLVFLTINPGFLTFDQLKEVQFNLSDSAGKEFISGRLVNAEESVIILFASAEKMPEINVEATFVSEKEKVSKKYENVFQNYSGELTPFDEDWQKESN